jgi:hypothetical protein
MMRLVLNDAEQSLESVPAHWGELLKGLEQTANGRGEVVTAVRFDGVDEPTFREPAQTGRALDDVEVIELQTATPSDLLDEALAQGASAAGTLSTAAGQIGSAFRLADLGEAHLRMAELVDGIRSVIWILGTAATVSGISLDEMKCNGQPVSGQLTELTARLVSMVEAQQSHDWLTVADILEYDLQPSLQAWQPIFQALRPTTPKAS